MTRGRLPARSYALVLIGVFVYLTVVRTHGISEAFFMLADQIRDWRIALGPFRDLPLVGTPSTAGGVSLGPVYYWLLWLSRVVIGPFTANLPHAGPVGMALVQGGSDLALLHAVRQRTGNTALAVALVVFLATGGPDLAVTATIWNPAVSVAFIKVAMALRLLRGADASLWWCAATTAAAWLSVQAHSAALFAAVPIAGSFVLDALLRRQWQRAVQQLRAIVEVIALLQVPYLVHALTNPQGALPSRALAGAAAGLRIADSLYALLEFTMRILVGPSATHLPAAALAVAALAVTVRARKDLPLWSATVAPLLVGTLGFALWQGNYDEYWYLPIAPAAALTLTMAVTWWRTERVALVLLALVVVAQPSRLEYAMSLSRMPEYGPLVRGSQRIVRQTRTLRHLDTRFPMPGLSDRAFPYEVLGGRFSEDAPFDAVINADGTVEFRPTR